MMLTSKQKILPSPEALERLQKLSAGPKKVGFAFGHFNVIHPGHLRFLHHARELCEVLVLAVMGQSQLEEPEKSRFFSAEDRALGVAALSAVDQVVVMEGLRLEDILGALKPQVFVLGNEFEEERRAEVEPYLAVVKSYGGKTVYSSGDVSYASTEALFSSPEQIHLEKLLEFQSVCQRSGIDLAGLRSRIGQFGKQRLLVIGDTIVDQYVACDALGMSQEAPVLVIRELDAKEFVGGAGIVACHIQTLGAQCHYLSVIGNDEKGRTIQRFLDQFQVPSTLLEDPTRPTTFKIRYMVDNQKLLRVSRLQEHSISKELERTLLAKVEEMAPHLDGIVVADFVYGVVTDGVLRGLHEIAAKHGIRLFGDLQCSSQVGNVGKFKHYHLITPTEREARIALADQESGLEKLARKLLSETQAHHLVLTLGAAGFIAYVNDPKGRHQAQAFPGLCQTPVDVAGAGDSLLATLAVSLCSGAELMEAAALGACTAAIAVSRVGNQPIRAAELENYVGSLLKQIPKTLS